MFQKVKSYQFTGFWELSKKLDIFLLAFHPKKYEDGPGTCFSSFLDILVVLKLSLSHEMFLQKVKSYTVYRFLGTFKKKFFLKTVIPFSHFTLGVSALTLRPFLDFLN